MSRPDRPAPAPARRGAGFLLSVVASAFLAETPPALAAPDIASAAEPAPAPATPRALPRPPAAPSASAGTGSEAWRGGFEAALRARLQREGRRQGIDRPPAPPAMPFGFEDEIDDESAAESGRRAGRTILRSLRGALDDHLETAARQSGSFGALFKFLDARGATTPVPLPSAGDLPAGAAPVPAAPREPAGFDFRFRLDAHPRLVLGGRVGRLEGRLEVPILEREIRMSVEHPIGGVGGAALRGGHSDERGSWADLSLSLRF